MWIFGLFLLLPLVEIALFVLVGQAIGLWQTLALVVLAAVAGVLLVRVNGLQTLMRTRASLLAGEDPVGPMAHGALLVLAGLLLVLPGFLSDAIGLLLLIPAVRAMLIAGVGARVVGARVHVRSDMRPGMRPETGPGMGSPRYAPQPAGARTIEGEFERVEDAEPSGPRGRSGWTRPD